MSIIDYIAQQCVRIDTVVSCAFRAALGIEAKQIVQAPTVKYRKATYDGIMECYEQKHGVQL